MGLDLDTRSIIVNDFVEVGMELEVDEGGDGEVGVGSVILVYLSHH